MAVSTEIDLFDWIAEERHRLADLLDSVAAEQWSNASSCRDWTTLEVLAHLVAVPKMGVRGSLRPLASSMFDLHKANVLAAGQLAAEVGPEALIAEFRANAASRFAPPGFGPQAPLTDVIIHGQDIARPLGLTIDVPMERIVVTLEAAVSRRFLLVNSLKQLRGLSFRALDTSWTWGEGPLIEGPALPLAHALWGRVEPCEVLEGDGVPELAKRLSNR